MAGTRSSAATRATSDSRFSKATRRAAWLRRGIVEPVLLRPDVTARIPLVRKARSYVEQANVDMPARMHTYNLLDRIGREKVFDAAFLAAVEANEPVERQDRFYSTCSDSDLVNRMLYFDWKHTLSDNDLPKVTGACDLADVAVGFPILDDNLVEFANGLPPHFKVRHLKLRYFFKDALSDFLPREIIVKKKHGFGMPFGNWMVAQAQVARDGDRQSRIAARSRRSSGARSSTNCWNRVAKHAGFYGELVWVMMMLEQWLAAHRPDYRFAAPQSGR